jgi:hypothetical protein
LESQDTQNSPARPERVSSRALATRLVGGAGALTAGLAIAGTVSQSVGGVIVVASWAYLVLALHRYGRGGPPGKKA